MLRRYLPLQNNHLYLTDSETESDDLPEYVYVQQRKKNNKGVYVGKKRYNKNKRNKKENIIEGESYQNMKALEENSETMIISKAEKYQQRMKQISIPTSRVMSPISFNSWQELAKSIKQKYEQPLHYLTHKLLKEWDQSRIIDSNININIKPLEDLTDSAKAESAIWVVEHFHRQCSSPQNLAKLWLSDPSYQDFVDPFIP